jgi:hypothetical protein
VPLVAMRESARLKRSLFGPAMWKRAPL